MALSTSMPAPRANPPSVIIFRVNPSKYISVNVANTEMGIANPITSVTVQLRNAIKSTRIAKNAPWMADVSTSPMASSTNRA